MEFKVNIHLRIITPAENAGELLIFLDESGQIPRINLVKEKSIDDQITEKIYAFFYENDLYTILSTKQISSISNSEDSLDIFYNFLSSSTESKIGSFVYYNQRSMELYRLANNHSV